MADCVKGVRPAVGAGVGQLAPDTPEKIAGFLFNGAAFSCPQLTMDKRTVDSGRYASRRSWGLPVDRHPFQLTEKNHE